MGARTQNNSGYSPLQKTFSFVTPKHRQKMTALWEQKVQKAEAYAQRQIANATKPRLKVVTSKDNDFDWDKYGKTLELPLWDYVASDYDVQPAAKEETTQVERLEVVTNTHAEEKAAWSDSDIEMLHEKVLEYSLSILNSKGNAKEKYDILQWIWAPDINCLRVKTVNGVNQSIPVYQKQIPFTFVTCCAYSGYSPEVLREKLAHMLRSVIKEIGLTFIINRENT